MRNSFIKMNLHYKLKVARIIPKIEAGAEGLRTIFVGFKNSLEAVSRYDIYVDSTKIYSQAWVGEESFIFNSGISQNVRERQPWVYSTYENVMMRSPDVCGVYLTIDNTANDIPAGGEIEIDIPVKINLHQILMLASIQYLPSFCGRWEIELYPSWDNLVILPIPLEAIAFQQPDYHMFVDLAALATGWRGISDSFTQIGKSFQYVEHITLNAGRISAVTVAAQTISGVDGMVDECVMSTTTFQLRYEVYEGLRQMYVENMLVIPTNILQYGRFSGTPTRNEDGELFHATLSQNLENCDSLFVLLPFEHGQRTCFYQPYLKNVRLSMGEFGIHPQQPVNTWSDMRFMAMALDSLNLEASEISGMNNDVLRSFMYEHPRLAVTAAGKAGQSHFRDRGDKSNFFIGFSLSQVGFQSGTVTSPNDNVPFMFDAILDRAGDHAVKPFDTSLVVMFLLDCAIMIQVVPDSDIPVVKLSSKSIV
jgi:hypothetical protein